VTYFKKALAILDAAGIGDREIVSKYANYLVALKNRAKVGLYVLRYM